MQLLSPIAPSLHVVQTFGDIFDSLDAKEFHTNGPEDVTVRFPLGTDEAAFDLFVRDEIDGAKLTLQSDAYMRCPSPQFDVERAVKYLGKAAGVTEVRFEQDQSAAAATGTLFVSASDEKAAGLLRTALVDQVELPGSQTVARIVIAPGEG